MTELARHLATRTPVATGTSTWAKQGLAFDLAAYLDEQHPPAAWVTSVRAVVRVGAQVVVLSNEDGDHYLPGGRMEPGETYADTLAREVEEECGLQVDRSQFLGFIHFRHTTPKPADYTYPYPDMLHHVYVAEASGTLRSGDVDGWELAARLAPAAEAADASASAMRAALPFLDAAMTAW